MKPTKAYAKENVKKVYTYYSLPLSHFVRTNPSPILKTSVLWACFGCRTNHAHNANELISFLTSLALRRHGQLAEVNIHLPHYFT